MATVTHHMCGRGAVWGLVCSLVRSIPFLRSVSGQSTSNPTHTRWLLLSQNTSFVSASCTPFVLSLLLSLSPSRFLAILFSSSSFSYSLSFSCISRIKHADQHIFFQVVSDHPTVVDINKRSQGAPRVLVGDGSMHVRGAQHVVFDCSPFM